MIVIPFANPSASYDSHNNEIKTAIRNVLESHNYVLGKEVEQFQNEFASFHGSDLRAIGVANGTKAIALALRCLGLKDGEEVITASHTAVATVSALEQAGCKPVFPTLTRLPDASAPNPYDQEFQPKQEPSFPFTYSANPAT